MVLHRLKVFTIGLAALEFVTCKAIAYEDFPNGVGA